MNEIEALRAAIAKMGREDAKLTLKALQKAELNVATNDTSQKRVDKTSEIVHDIRNQTLEEVAQEFDKMPFGDTAASFARFVRGMKDAKAETT